MALRIPRTSVEYITAELGGAPDDIVESTVQAALELETVTAAAVSWQSASWDPDSVTPTVRWLYGGNKAAGTYVFWSKVTDSPEIPVRRHGAVFLDP